MDLFMIIFLLLLCWWSLVYLYKNTSIKTKYKITILNFVLSTLLILGIYYSSNDLWRFSVIQWIFIPNIFSGSIVPLFGLIIYTLIQSKEKK